MSKFDRKRVVLLEIDIDRCQNTYGVAPCTASGTAGTECYNCWATCQDKANYVRGIKTWSFCTPGAPVPAGRAIRPYLIDLDPSPTEIDLERGLPRAGAVTLTLADEICSDIEADAYHATRPAAAGGTFWARFIARNPNYAGRFARLKTAYFTDGWDDAAFTTELYIIERIDPPDSRGRVRLTLKDPTKLADRRTMPEATDGKLTAAMAADATFAQLGSGHGALYPAAGFIRIDDEVIEYTSKVGDVLTWPDYSWRGRFNTVAATHDAGDGVQLCQVWQGVRVHQVLDDLFAGAGVPPANIDSAGFLSEDDNWLSNDFAVTACISEPEKITKLISELVVQIGAYTWWEPESQLMRFKVIAPLPLDAAPVIELTEVAQIVEGSVKIERLEDKRLTVAGIWYDPKSATADPDKTITYLRGEIWIDADAESANEYGDRRSDIRTSRWFTAANEVAVRVAVSRRTGRYRDAPQRIHCLLDAKDRDIKAADLIDVSVSQVVGFDGQPATVRAIVTRRKDEGGRVALRMRATDLDGRFGFWAPDATGDYPADSQYAHWAPDTEIFPDGTGPYLYF